MMINIFTEVLSRNPDKVDEALTKCKLCLREGDTIGKDKVKTVINGKMVTTTFRQGKVINISEKDISIGTSLNKEAVKKRVEELFKICGTSDDVLYVDWDKVTEN